MQALATRTPSAIPPAAPLPGPTLPADNVAIDLRLEDQTALATRGSSGGAVERREPEHPGRRTPFRGAP